MAESINNMIFSRQTKKTQIQQRNNQHKINMDKGKEIKQKMGSEIDKYLQNQKKEYLQMIKNIDMDAMASLFFEISKKMNDEGHKISTNRMVKQFLNLIMGHKRDEVSLAGISHYILSKNETINMKTPNNKALQSSFMVKKFEHPFYKKFINQIQQFWQNKIPTGCPNKCKCGGFMEDKLLVINRCIRCTPFLSYSQNGYTMACLRACKAVNFVKEGSLNPPMGFCCFCMIDLIVNREDIIKCGGTEYMALLINTLIILYNRTKIEIDIYGNHELDRAMLTQWFGHNSEKGRLCSYGDDTAEKLYKIKHINKFFQDANPTSFKKIKLIKFTYRVGIETIIMDIDENDNDDEKKQENGADDDGDDAMGINEDNDDQWFEHLEEDERGLSYESDEKIVTNKCKEGEIVATKYSNTYCERFWFIYTPGKTIIKSWYDESFKKDKRFGQFNKINLPNSLDNNGNYTPSSDTELINNAYPCIDFSIEKNKNLKEHLLKVSKAKQSQSMHEVILLVKLFDKDVNVVVIDVNDDSQKDETEFENIFINKWRKLNHKCYKKMRVHFLKLNINGIEFVTFYQKIIDKRIDGGFCDVSSNLIVKVLWDSIKKKGSKIKNYDIKQLISSIENSLRNDIVKPLTDLKIIWNK